MNKNTINAKQSVSLKLLLLANVIVSLALLLSYLSTFISPNTIPYLAFFGLAYSYILSANFIFIIIWIIFKRKYILFNVIVILLGWNHFTDFYAFNNSTTVHSTNDMKVLSYNVRIFNYYDSQHKIESRNNIFNFLEQQQADVYCLQEFYHQDNSVDFKTKDTLPSIINTKYSHERFTHEMTGKQFFGLMTFSKYPIINKGGVKFDNDDNNYCIYSDIVKGNDTIRIFNAHIGSIRLQDSDYAFFGDKETGQMYQRDSLSHQIIKRLKLAFGKRAVQIEKIMEVVKQTSYKVVLCGDFNDTPISYCYRQVKKELNDAFITSGNGIGATYIGKLPSNRIDFIFTSNLLQASEFTVHNVNYSDHKPISCYIGNVFD